MPFDKEPKLEVVYGPNERGKSSALRGLKALLFGIRQRTTDNHRFDNALLRIGASLVDDKNEIVEVVRRKALKKTLLRPDGTPFDSDAIVANYSEEEFEHLFGFDHESLRKSGEELTKGKGAYTSTLWAATTGYVGAQRLLESLSDEAQSIFGPAKRTSSLNKLLDDHHVLERRSSESTTTPESYKTQVATLAEYDRRILSLRTEEASFETDRRRAQYQLEVAEQRARIDALDEQIAPLAHVPVTTAEHIARVSKAIEDEADARRSLAETDARRTAFVSELEATGEPTLILTQEDAILALENSRPLATKAREAIKPLEARRERLEQEAIALKQGLPEALVAVASHVTRTTAERGRAIAIARSELERERHVLFAERDRLADELSGDSVDDDAEERESARASLEEASLLLSEAQSLRELRARAALEQATLNEHLVALGLSSSQQLLVPPSKDETDSWLHREQRRRDAKEALERDVRAASRAHRDAATTLTALEASVPAVAPHALEKARGERDHIWTELQSGSTSEVAFLAAVADVDKLVDILLASADELAEAKRLRREVASFVNKLDGYQHELDAHNADAASLQTEIATRLSAWAGAPSQAHQATAWVARLREASDVRARSLEWHTSLTNADATFSARFARVAAAANFEQECDPARVAVLFEAAKRKLSLIDQRAGETREIESRRARARVRLHAIGIEANTLDRREENLAREAGQLISALTIDSTNALELLPHLDRTERLGVLHEESQTLASDHRRNDDFATSFDRDLAALSSAISAAPTLETLTRAALELRKETEDEARRSYLRAKINDLAADRAVAEARLSKTRSELALLLDPLGLQDAVAFGAVRDQIATVATMRLQRGREEIALRQKQKLEPQFAREPEGDNVSVSELRERIEGAILGLQESRGKRDDILAERVACELGLRQFEKGSSAADFSLDASMIAADIDAHARQYARLKAAQVLLRISLDRNQREYESPLLTRANRFFAQLTHGAYEAMRVELGDRGEPELRAIARGKNAKAPSELSEGTRNQMFLALKLASVEHACKQRAPLPLVLDDVLVHFDDERSEAALETLAELSTVTQVLLFTHHRRVADFASKLRDARVREL